LFWGVGATERPFYDAGHVYKPAAINEYKWEISYFQNTYKRSPFHFRFLFSGTRKRDVSVRESGMQIQGKVKQGKRKGRGKMRCSACS